MKIKYSPCKWNLNAAISFPEGTKPDTEIKVLDQNIIEIDGQWYGFDSESVEWPDIHTKTDGRIQEAKREGGDLFIIVRRFYTSSCSGWDTGDYHDVQPEVPQ